MYIYLYIYHKYQPNVGKYTSPMDPMGIKLIWHAKTQALSVFSSCTSSWTCLRLIWAAGSFGVCSFWRGLWLGRELRVDGLSKINSAIVHSMSATATIATTKHSEARARNKRQQPWTTINQQHQLTRDQQHASNNQKPFCFDIKCDMWQNILVPLLLHSTGSRPPLPALGSCV